MAKEEDHITQLLISPAESSPIIRDLGTFSRLCEDNGVDILWQSELGEWCGIQRKELHDLIASLHDNRLTKELIQMAELDVRILIIEGVPKWGPDGNMLDRFSHWSRKGHHNLIQSLSMSGISVHQTTDTQDTAHVIAGLVEWSNKPSHTTLMSRTKNIGKKWGEPTSEEWQLWVLQSFPGISITRARQIIKHFGTIPLLWTVSAQDLEQVPGIGKTTAARLVACLNPVLSAASGVSSTSPTHLPDSPSPSVNSTSATTPSSRGLRNREVTMSRKCSPISKAGPLASRGGQEHE